MSLNNLLLQFLQPYFFFSLAFLSISFACVSLMLKLHPSMSKKRRSMVRLVPLLVPVIVLILFNPRTMIPVQPLLLDSTAVYPALSGLTPAFFTAPSSSLTISSYEIQAVSVTSITGLLCICGAIAATAYLLITVVLGRRIVIKAFHVIMMFPDEYPELRESIRELSRKLGIAEPRIGMVDDLRPNAFVVGCGRRTMVVFSLGLLKILDHDELRAVAAHELAHIRSSDHLFKSATRALNMLSFYNPLSYFAASLTQKERELLADEQGAALLERPKMLADVLSKLGGVLQGLPKERLSDQLMSRLFLVAPLIRKPEILASHPQISSRVRNIRTMAYSAGPRPRPRAAALSLSVFLVLAAVLSGSAAVEVQQSYFQHDAKTASNDASTAGLQPTVDYCLSESGTYLSSNVTTLPGPTDLAVYVLYGNATAGR